MPLDAPPDARPPLLLTLAFIVVVVATPVGAWWWLAAEGMALAIAVVLVRLPLTVLIRRWLGFAVLVGFLALAVAANHPDQARVGYWGVVGSIVAKNSLAIGAMLALAHATPLPDLLTALARLGVPDPLVTTLRLMERQVHILRDELGRMARARRSRTFRRSGRLDPATLASLIGMLFLRSFERGERVHAAMLARGWDGTSRALRP